nr:CMGC/DYRK/DYRK2 protein kinase [Cryptococcus depauperatus CBS 7855]
MESEIPAGYSESSFQLRSPSRQRLLSSTSISSMSSSPRGRRAPAPAALDLSPGGERSRYYAELGHGSSYTPKNARVVTEPPLHFRSPQELPGPVGISHIPLHNASLHPSRIDRRDLVGVGELSTPRWQGHAEQPRARDVLPMPQTPAHVDMTVRQRSNSAVQTPPRLPIKSPARQQPGEASTAPASAIANDSLFSLASLAQFSFDSGMETSLVASLANLSTKPVVNEDAQKGIFPPHINTTIPPSPGSARSRIYARRQERERASTGATYVNSVSQPPSSADSQTQSFRAGRETSHRTPPNPRHSSSHDIIKQFAVNFSHLPPSPSSASIDQFLRQSGSVNNISSTPPASASTTTSYFGGRSLQREDSQKSQKQKATTSKAGDKFDPNIQEALRKLDGLATAKHRNRSGSVAVRSTSGTPPDSDSEKRMLSKATNSSFKDTESLMSNWVDLNDDIPAIPISRGRAQPKRESASSASIVGTPTSRDSHSLPTTATTLSSTDIGLKTRRTSTSSDLLAQGVNTEHKQEEAEENVPPVPPLPQLYVNKKQGLSVNTSVSGASDGSMHLTTFVPMHESTLASTIPPLDSTSPLTLAPQPKMQKKWSFSSALNLKPTPSPVPSTDDITSATPRSPQTPWSDVNKGEMFSSDFMQSEIETPPYSATISATPHAPPVKPSANSKRLTPSSIPFFRRSSSSFHPKLSQPQVPESLKQSEKIEKSTPATQRKSVLGMHLPSMLRGSASKRGLAGLQQPTAKEKEKTEIQDTNSRVSYGSTGWTGRKRGKTLSISGDLPKPTIPALKHQTSADSTLSGSRASAVSNKSDITISGSSAFDRLPAIVGSPARPIEGPRYSNSPRNLPSATPTKIPRMTRLAPSPATISTSTSYSMPPPVVPTHRKTSNTVIGSGSEEQRLEMPVSEFGMVESVPLTPRQSTSSAQRAHLLASMSVRQQGTRRSTNRPSDPPRRELPATVAPPSRRQLPRPPSSTVTAMTLSASAKRASREFKNRRESKEPEGIVSGKSSPIKPSKSLHSGIAPPSTVSRLPSSHSAGAAGANFRKSSFAESPSMIPADDEEISGDAEMEAYLKKRRERAATNKKDDLVDVNEFPEDIPPAEPITQRKFITKNLAKMSDQERKEVLDFDLIYYSPSPGKIIRQSQHNVAIYNYGYDDERGDYLVVEGDHLCYRYEVVGVLGKGSFGQVVQCRDHKTGRSVAVKIIRNKKRFHAQALVEVKILQQLVEWDPEDKHFMVRMTDHFSFRNHLCIVTELLSINLYELIKANQFAGFTTVLIRRFTTQMLASLQLMRSHRVVHCDLKPENILLCHPAKSAIKVIDFGSSCLETEKVYTYIQSRFYRSPEVILGMNYAMAIDMWSLGCILAELYTGVPIFPGENEHEQLACIMEVLGMPDHYIIEKASRRKNFFDATGAPRPFVNAKGRRRRPGTKTLANVLKCDDELFVDFIARCLTWDPDKRMKPQPAMRHPWILAGRKRYAPTPVRDKTAFTDYSSRLFGSTHTSTKIGAKNLGELGELATPSGKRGDKEKGKLLISSPVPLRQPHHSSTASTSRIAPTTASSRLSQQATIRNGSFNVRLSVLC